MKSKKNPFKLMLSAGASGSGKTVITCALLAAFKQRGLRAAACKCGPDYIDPLFHRSILGVPSENLDLFFCGEKELQELFRFHSEQAEVVVAEGVMGYYDGLSLETDRASSYDVARTLQLPVILIVPCKGAALSVVPMILGMLEFRQDHRIRGILLNRVSPALYPRLKQMIEEELRKRGYTVPVVGYVPEQEIFRIESRHLGLKLPEETAELKERLETAGKILCETVDLDLLLRIAGERDNQDNSADLKENGSLPKRQHPALGNRQVGWGEPAGIGGNEGILQARNKETRKEDISAARIRAAGNERISRLRIGIARDEAFCFYYEDNLRILESFGCEPVFFSPLRDVQLPENIGGLLLGGGYPELYAKDLSENRSLRAAVRNALEKGLPCLAECGGFLYLQETLEDGEGNTWPMAGYFHGQAYRTKKLGRFGYLHLRTEKDGIYLKEGEEIRGHEFHYWDCTENGKVCLAVKPDGKRSWPCVQAEGAVFAGFPHLYFRSNPEFARRFVRRCREYKSMTQG